MEMTRIILATILIKIERFRVNIYIFSQTLPSLRVFIMRQDIHCFPLGPSRSADWTYEPWQQALSAPIAFSRLFRNPDTLIPNPFSLFLHLGAYELLVAGKKGEGPPYL